MTHLLNISSHLLLSILLLCFSLPVLSHSTEEMQRDQILEELRQIRKLLEGNAAGGRHQLRPPIQELAGRAVRGENADQKSRVSFKIALENRAMLGDREAPLTLIEFTDYECPFCKKFSINSLDVIKKKYIKTGKLKLYVKELPLEFHKNARKLAELALCSGKQNKYWQVRKAIFSKQGEITASNFENYITDLGIEINSVRKCLDEGFYDAQIEKDITDASDIGISATPWFLLGKYDKNGNFDGIQIKGAQPTGNFVKEIEAMLQK
jgi:protein-disulfide isomerase